MIIPGALAALGYLVFVIALAVFMSLVCSMFGVTARRLSQASPLIRNDCTTQDGKSTSDDSIKNYCTTKKATPIN